MIKLTGGGTGGGGEQVSPGPGLPPPVTPPELNDPVDSNKSGLEAVENFVSNTTDATMSFVLQLGTVETPEEVSNNNTSVLGQELGGSIPIGANISKPLLPSSNNNKPQSLQSLKTVSVTTVSTASALPPTVKPVTVTYPVNKNLRDAQRVGGSQTTTTQVLTTRVISQKLPASGHQTHPTNLPLNTAHALHIPVKSSSLPSSGNSVSKVQSAVPTPNTFSQNANVQTKVSASSDLGQNKQLPTTITNLQTTMHQKLQVSAQQILGPSGMKTITTTSVPSIQRIQVKSQGVGGKAHTVNLQKVKTISNVNNQTGQRANLPRIQTVPKSQGLQVSATQGIQVSMSQVMNSANMQRVQQVNSSNVGQHGQRVHQPLSAQKVTQVFNNQKSAQAQIIDNTAGHGIQKVQQPQQVVHKVQGVAPKAIAVQRQQQSNATNNFTKSVNSVAGIQKVQTNTQQQNQLQQKNVHTTQQQRPQTTATLQKSQTLAMVNSQNKLQSVANIAKSNSVPNISKLHQNQNVINVSKQPMANQQQQQIHTPQLSQLQQQLMHQTSQQQQQQINLVPQTQRSQTVTGMQQKMATITSVPNNQRAQATANSKTQQQPQMVLRVGPAKNQSQNVQAGNLKPVSQKMINSVKPLNQQNAAQQSNRTVNSSQPVKIIQQQNAIGPQNTQKQPGCIKTIPAQKPGLKNHVQKISGIKTSLNTNLSSLKGQGTPTPVAQKTSIKTLLPQQSGGQNILSNKNQPIKIQQQTIQQKQILMNAQYPQQTRNQSGQIKTLLPVVSVDTRREGDVK